MNKTLFFINLYFNSLQIIIISYEILFIITLFFYTDDGELLKNIQKNLNTGKPQVLIRHINNSNNNQLITLPQVTSKDQSTTNTIKKQDDLFNMEDFESIANFNNSSIEKQCDKTDNISSFDHNTILKLLYNHHHQLHINIKMIRMTLIILL